ncbi:endogenous retrovirus group K member 8 Pol protein-like protein [Willisornis vidua]|uniref:Endogenous retrovirus group K member 8 Pol protein-like protein n=1 Tax=Willisornis vidua TaxID=1566151 RepID=A0ABQ9DMC7_9PASS|nr:endogenous retrovirus group K member 8 Pol protein-like protein [Willisornis vidua]
MKNLPTLCQTYVAKILSPIRIQNPTVIIYHYMDDILICAEYKNDVIRVLKSVTNALQAFRLYIAPEKIQWDSPWHYLGWKLSRSSITPQKIKIDHNIKTLNDMQKLLGNINWIRPQLGITTDELSPLFDLLQGEADLNSPRSLTREALESLRIVEYKISNMQSQRKLAGIPPITVVLCGPNQPFAVLGQIEQNHDEIVIWEWIFLPHCFAKTLVTFPELLSKVVIKARMRCWEMTGEDPHTLFIPINSESFDNMLLLSADFQLAVQDFKGQIQFSLPGKKIMQKLKYIPMTLKVMQSFAPIPGAVTVFTDRLGRTGKAVVTWKVGGEWCHDCHVTTGSSQVVELSAMVRAFTIFSDQPLNIVSDSAYVVGVVKRAEHSYLKKLRNKQLFSLFRTLMTLIGKREHAYYIVHICSHSALPGPVVEGNHQADMLAGVSVVPNLLQQVRASHEFLHQNAKSLQKEFNLTQNQAKEIVKGCPECQKVSPLQPMGVNPRGLGLLQLWQTDVTHIPQFGRLKYVHVSIDTFSKLMVALAHTGEKSRDVQ